MLWIRTVIAACICLAFTASTTTAIAQESTSGMAGMTEYPVAIHEGTCDAPVSQPAWDIDNTAPYGQGDADAEGLLTTTIAPVLATSATIDANLDTLGNN